jgi:hypothetical protein
LRRLCEGRGVHGVEIGTTKKTTDFFKKRRASSGSKRRTIVSDGDKRGDGGKVEKRGKGKMDELGGTSARASIIKGAEVVRLYSPRRFLCKKEK